MSAVLDELAEGADLILTGMTYQEVAANVAEHRHIPLAALHFCPVRPSSQTLPVRLPAPLLKPFFAMTEWGFWRLFKSAEDAQRSALGLPASRARSQRRIEASGALEIQAYDKVFYPQLAKEWGASRPLVGSVTMQRSTDADQDVLAWVAAGSPPIYFGLGSMPIEDPAATVAMIAGVCAQLGERALICLAAGDLDTAGYGDHVMIVPSVNHALVFPRCRAIVHHGGSGTTAASTRSGVPTVILWVGADQPAWAARVESLGIGTGRRFSATDHDSLLEMLRSVLTPGCAERARSVAAQMTTPEAAVTAAATLIEAAARAGSPSRAAY
jgi:UDP:flavonoid glycosyltransferase YjiC (YdhE family)